MENLENGLLWLYAEVAKTLTMPLIEFSLLRLMAVAALGSYFVYAWSLGWVSRICSAPFLFSLLSSPLWRGD